MLDFRKFLFEPQFFISFLFQHPDIELQGHHLVVCPSAGYSGASRSRNHQPTRLDNTRCDNGSAYFFCYCVSSFLIEGPILLATRQLQEIAGNQATTLYCQLRSRSSTLENRRATH